MHTSRFGGRWPSALGGLALLSAHASAFAQSSAGDAAATSATPAPKPAVVSAPEPEGAHSSRLPAVIAFGSGGLAAGGAVISGIFAKTDYDDAQSSCSPLCSDDELSSGRRLAVTSTILTGVAIVGVGVGLTLLLTSGPDPAQISLAPRLQLTAAPNAARADATWRF
jgi:hypothetical protein